MRYNLVLSSSNRTVPFDHLHVLTGAVHKWLGENDLHDGTSLYSFGWLRGGRVDNGRLSFPNGARWRVSFYDLEAAKRLMEGLLKDPHVAFGMRVVELHEQNTPRFGATHRFLVDGPVLARARRPDGSRAHLIYDDPAADEAMTRVLRWKLQEAGFSEADQAATSVRFDRTYDRPRTKKTTIKGIGLRANECPVIIQGTPETVRFAWHVGVGELTGSGFGALI